MDSEQFRAAAHQMVDYVIDYLDNIRNRRVLPTVEPGYLRKLIPEEAPEQGETWQSIFQDIERVIMPGVTHWHSPNFHAYYPTGNSWPAMLADILSDAIGCVGFSWIASPACTELEVVMMDWLGKLIGLPPVFLASTGGKGGGVIQGTASEAMLVGLLAARSKTLKRLKAEHPEKDEKILASRLIAYSSDQSHSAAERAGLLAGVHVRVLPTDDQLHLRADALQSAIKEDTANGKIPFFVVATLGTTPACSFDDIDELGPVCNDHLLWLHVDAAYAGSAFVCEEYHHYMKGVERADSFNFNPHKWLLVNFDCSAMWFKDADDIVSAFNVDPIFLKHDHQNSAPDFRHWQIPLGRRFRSLKLWFVMRSYGAQGLRDYIRKQIHLAEQFHQMLAADDRFEFPVPPSMGLVCFRLKGENSLSERLLKRINEAGQVYMIPAKLHETYIIRFAVCSRYTELSDVQASCEEIRRHANDIVSA
ncbi:hypothetical protein GHT06_020015 [Daphnia sinensis]|uniref:Aromatic-L-amino-acid decarboxylase n=1 Tax=Daphnia sinensis TaxID=1820382 RepID=A0AAD5KLK8_9CRUS|nr:hypothetical protein GHT06_020015 [Daphnia sinensis]